MAEAVINRIKSCVEKGDITGLTQYIDFASKESITVPIKDILRENGLEGVKASLSKAWAKDVLDFIKVVERYGIILDLKSIESDFKQYLQAICRAGLSEVIKALVDSALRYSLDILDGRRDPVVYENCKTAALWKLQCGNIKDYTLFLEVIKSIGIELEIPQEEFEDRLMKGLKDTLHTGLADTATSLVAFMAQFYRHLLTDHQRDIKTYLRWGIISAIESGNKDDYNKKRRLSEPLGIELVLDTRELDVALSLGGLSKDDLFHSEGLAAV
jgi:hypothetical protein